MIKIFFILNKLDFSKVYTQYADRLDKKYNYISKDYSYIAYYDLNKPNNNLYLLLVINKYHFTGKGNINHLNRPNLTSIELMKYSSL